MIYRVLKVTAIYEDGVKTPYHVDLYTGDIEAFRDQMKHDMRTETIRLDYETIDDTKEEV